MSKEIAAVCHICGKEFQAEKYCRRHIKSIHNFDSKGELVPKPPPVSFLCSKCGRKFSQKSTLRRHLNTVHEMIKKTLVELKCDDCDFKTVHRSNMKRHWARVHQGKQRTVESKVFKCPICPAKYKELRNLKYHEKKRHKLSDVRKVKRKCPLCQYVSLEMRKDEIFKHFTEVHNIDLSWQTIKFNSREQFELWKKNIEHDTSSHYAKHFESKQQAFYQCNRSGNYIAKGVNIRRIKSIGSCKINGFCPSAIKLSEKNGIFDVSYLPVHIGHETDPKHVRPSCGGLGCGRKFKRAVRSGGENIEMEKKQIHESAVIVAVINENDLIENEVVVEENSVPELDHGSDIDMVANPQSYNDDQDTMLYLEKVRLFQEFRNFEGFLQKNVNSMEQISYVRREIDKIVSDINASNASLNIGE